MSTDQDEPTKPAPLPAASEAYRKVAGPIGSQQLAQAMALLQKSAARAVFPREANAEDLKTETVVMSRLPMVPSALESAVLASQRPHRTTEKEASRLYAGARPYI